MNIIDGFRAMVKAPSSSLVDYVEGEAARLGVDAKEAGLAPVAARWRTTFDGFLRSTMDEVRLHHANRCAYIVLQLADARELDALRHGVLRREMGGAVSFQKQRDHSAHTVNNWLLGWYLYLNCEPLRQHLHDQIVRRHLDDQPASTWFGDLWWPVSLMHDIGYLFEGAVHPLTAELESRLAQVGVSVIRDFFAHRFWSGDGLPSTHDRRLAHQCAGVEPIEFTGVETLIGIADRLRAVGSLAGLTSAIHAEIAHTPRAGLVPASLPGDAFDLWCEHYRRFAPAMVEHLHGVERVFVAGLHDGVHHGLRLLDHAVCSGLVQLLYTTHYYALHHGARRSQHFASLPAHIRAWFGRPDHQAYSWWAGCLWSSAATAVHDIFVHEEWLGEKHARLAIEDDALAYLGILVDILQTWDRFPVVRGGALTGKLPLQGIDVEVDESDTPIRFAMPESYARKVRADLDRALQGWQHLVIVDDRS